jgi:hypothetical protein
MARKAIELDAARRGRLMAALEAGATLRMAAAAAGVSEDTLSRWRKTRPDLQAEINQAEAQGAVKALEQIRAAAQGGAWQAAAWMLERRYPNEYGRRAPAVENVNELEIVRGWLSESAARYQKLAMAQREAEGALRPLPPLEGLEDMPAKPDLLVRAERLLREREGLSFA